jgi:hypothetical protein
MSYDLSISSFSNLPEYIRVKNSLSSTNASVHADEVTTDSQSNDIFELRTFQSEVFREASIEAMSLPVMQHANIPTSIPSLVYQYLYVSVLVCLELVFSVRSRPDSLTFRIDQSSPSRPIRPALAASYQRSTASDLRWQMAQRYRHSIRLILRVSFWNIGMILVRTPRLCV